MHSSRQAPPPSRPAPPRPAMSGDSNSNHSQGPPPRPVEPPRQAQGQQEQQYGAGPSTGAGGGGIFSFSSIKGGAGSFLKNLKDTSSKVMQTVQQTIARTDLDISYITSRVLAMPCPSEGLEAAYKTNNIDDVRVFFESRHQLSKISVYNLGPRQTARLPPPVRTVECSFIYYPHPPKAPHLQGLYAMAEDMYGFLNSDPKAIVVVQSGDQGKATAATLIAALFLYAGLVREPEDAMQMFAVKRTPPGVRASDLRYLYYMGDLTRKIPHLPHFKPVTLVSLQIAPIPMMTKARDGCRLYIEIVSNDRVDLTTLQEYERMRLYHVTEGKIALPLNITLCGDITVSVYHARNALKGMGRPQGLKVCQLQFHTGFIPEEETLIHYDKNELDELAGPEQIPGQFHLSLSVFVADTDRMPAKNPPWVDKKATQRNAQALFDSTLEFEETVDNFVTKPTTRGGQERLEKPQRPPPRPVTPVPQVKREVMEERINEPEPQPAAFVDLLNLNGVGGGGGGFGAGNPIPKLSEMKVQQPATQSFDLLGSFDSGGASAPSATTASSSSAGPFSSGPAPDLLGGTQKLDILDDIFSNPPPTTGQTNSGQAANGSSFNIGAPLRPNAGPVGEQPKAQVKQEQPQKPSDPFSTFGNITSDWLGLGASASSSGTKPSSAPSTQRTSPSGTGQPPSTMGQQTTTTTPPMTSPRFPSTPVANQKTNEQATRPDYSRSNFGAGGAPGAPAGNNQKPMPGSTSGGDIFGDILGSQGYSFASRPANSTRSINAMRKEEMVKEMDPEKIKILEWVSS